MKKLFSLFFVLSIFLGCKKEANSDLESTDTKAYIAKLKRAFLDQTPDSIVTVDSKEIKYFPNRKVLTTDSTFSNFNIYSSLNLKNKLRASTISVEDTEVEVPGVKNPARVQYRAKVKCEAYSNGVFFVESVSQMSMSVLNGSQTTYHPNGITESWYTTITGASYSHSPVGGPSVTLYYNGTKIVRHTIQQGNTPPQSTIKNVPINTSRTVVATGTLL